MLRHIRPGDVAVFVDVAARNLVRDSLMAERTHQPVEYLRCVALGDGVGDTGFLNISADVVKKCQ
jgi:hypothetical protein